MRRGDEIPLQEVARKELLWASEFRKVLLRFSSVSYHGCNYFNDIGRYLFVLSVSSSAPCRQALYWTCIPSSQHYAANTKQVLVLGTETEVS